MLAGVVGCAECPACLGGFNTACWKGPTGLAWGRHGATATHVVWPERCVLPLPSALSFDSAAVLTCAGGTAYTIVRETRLTAADRLAVVGLGPVGLSLVILAKAMGASVVGIDLDKSRLDQASALGADSVVDASSQDAIAAVRAFSRDADATSPRTAPDNHARAARRSRWRQRADASRWRGSAREHSGPWQCRRSGLCDISGGSFRRRRRAPGSVARGVGDQRRSPLCRPRR